MLREKIVSLLKVRPEEIRMVTLMAVLFLVVQAGQGFGDTAAFALFVSHNVDRLPYMYAPLGLIVFLTSMAYTASLGRFQNANVVLWFLAGFVFLLAGEWLAIVLFQLPITQYFWLTVNGMNVVLGTLLWTTAGEVCDARQAKRLFPLFTSVGILGSVLGNSLTGVLASIFGTSNLIVLYAVVLGGGVLLLRTITSEYFKPEPPLLTKYSFVSDLRSGFDFVSTSGLFRLVAITSILYSILFFTIDFPFSQFVSKNFLEDEVKVANFKGLFSSAATLITFFVSLFLANRLYTKLGIVNSILIAPITYLLGLVTFFVFFRFEGAVPVRFLQQVMLGGIMGTAWNALFNVVPIERRGQVLAFMNGVPAQIGVILSGLLLVAGSRIFTTQQILLMGALVALVCFYFTWKMRAEYGNALVAALQAGRVEVFSDEDDAFAGFEKDPAALQATFNALQDPKPFTRRLAAEMLAKMGSPLAVPELVRRLVDDDASVRAAATQALADLNAKEVFYEVVMGLDDSDDSVREKTLASFPKLEAVSSPELIRTLERLLDDQNVRIQARAAMVLVYLGEASRANAFISLLLNDDNPDKRYAAIDAFRVIAVNTKGTISLNADLIIKAMTDEAHVVRREAVKVAVYLKDDSIYEALAARLADKDAGVRKAASESLKQVWPASRSVVLRVLAESDGMSADLALKSIPPGDADVVDALRSYIQHEVAHIRYLRMKVEPLPQKGRATLLLGNTLKQRVSMSEDHLIDAVGLFGNPHAMDLVRRSLHAGDTATRAAALEAFETLGDKRITTEVLPILDRGGIFQDDEQHRTLVDVVEELLASEESWLRALTVYVVKEQELFNFKSEVRKLTYDPVPLVKDAARNSISQMDGTVVMKKIVNVKTLKTLSTLDRILLLREVPMFAGLTPEDLERIADIADEQLFPKESFLCVEGEPGNTLFIIASGKVEVIKRFGATERVLATHGASEYVGEMAILESAPRSASLKANGDARVLVIDGNAFKTILLDRPEVAVAVLRNMSSRLRELNARVAAAN
ncbi:MAG: Npt1/Npt2 family nucleotide transporter [Chloroflexota bacterium]